MPATLRHTGTPAQGLIAGRVDSGNGVAQARWVRTHWHRVTGSHQLADRLHAAGEVDEVAGDARVEAHLADIKHRVQERAGEVIELIRFSLGNIRELFAGSDRLAHLQAAAGKNQCAKTGPVIPTAFGLDFHRAAKFTGDDQQYLVRQAARPHIIEKRAYRMIQRSSQNFHALHYTGVFTVAVIVPARHAHRNKPTPGFRKASSHEQPFTDGGGTFL